LSGRAFDEIPVLLAKGVVRGGVRRGRRIRSSIFPAVMLGRIVAAMTGALDEDRE
jgi:hypothetical protein